MNKMLKHVQVFSYKNSLVYQYKVSFLLSIQVVKISDYEWTHDNKKLKQSYLLFWLSNLLVVMNAECSERGKNRIKVT